MGAKQPRYTAIARFSNNHIEQRLSATPSKLGYAWMITHVDEPNTVINTGFSANRKGAVANAARARFTFRLSDYIIDDTEELTPLGREYAMINGCIEDYEHVRRDLLIRNIEQRQMFQIEIVKTEARLV